MAATSLQMILDSRPQWKFGLRNGLIPGEVSHSFCSQLIDCIWSRFNITRFQLALAILLGSSPSICFGQALATATSRMDAGAFVTGGLMNTQVPYYSDNALGVNIGVFVQPTPLLGLEVRAGAYPFSSRFVQAPFTGGIRFSSRASRNWRAQLFGYLGGGMSRSEDEGVIPIRQVLPAKWDPCWQTSAGVDLPFRRWKWRVFEANWTETYTPQRSLRSLSVNTGLVYILKY